MATASLVSVSEYLSSSYSPDMDYVDGYLLERNVGEERHSFVQIALATYLFSRRKEWNITAYTEQRVQVTGSRFRIPDVCAVQGGRSAEQIFQTPPLLCVEVLSPSDTISAMQERIDDYLKFGVGTVWVIDPNSRRGWIYSADSIVEAKDGILRLSKPSSIQVPLNELFD